jgi:VanZ family protein
MGPIRGSEAVPRGWWCRRLLPLAVWIVVILVAATRPAESLVSRHVTSALQLSRDLVQYPYHVGSFVVLAVLMLRCLEGLGWSERRAIVATAVGAAIVSISSELLQIVTPTRAPAVGDLALDLTGAGIGVVLARVVARGRSGPVGASLEEI